MILWKLDKNLKLDILKVLEFWWKGENCFKSWVSYYGSKYLILKQLYCGLCINKSKATLKFICMETKYFEYG